MKRSMAARIVGVMCAAVLAMAALAGCTASSQTNEQAQQQSANRQYMSQVNQIMDDLESQLDGFSDAVSGEDLVTMRTQADNASKVIDRLGELQPPDSLKDIHADYVDGCNGLKDALNGYIQLYTDIASATEVQPFDYATYDQRIAEVQEKYQDGIEKLQAADEAASKME